MLRSAIQGVLGFPANDHDHSLWKLAGVKIDLEGYKGSETAKTKL
jgi:hypothetical protein